MLWQKTDRTFTGTKICFIDVRRNYPIPPKFTKINAQRVPTAPRVFLIFPTISGRMTFCAVLAYVSRLNFNVWSLHVCICVCVCLFANAHHHVHVQFMSILYAQISIRSHITRSHNKMKRENEMNRQIDDMKRKKEEKKNPNKKKKTKTEKNNKTQ